MFVIKLLKKHLIDSQIYVSLAGTLLAVFFILEQDTFRYPTILLVFITYFSGYLYTKYQYHRFFYKILFINVICGIISAVLIYHNHHEIRLVKWLVIVFLGLLYNSKFLENYIRKIPLVKVFYVGLVWALVNSWLSFPTFNFPIFVISFLFVTALVLPFDIRDFRNDKVITFPKIIGVQNSKYLAYLLVFLSVLVAIFALKPAFAVSFYITAIFTNLLIYFSDENRSDCYYSFGVESMSLLPFLVLQIGFYFEIF